jgi:hypothetical protein
MLFSFNRGTTLLPNDDILPTADAFTECFEENLLPNGAFCTKLSPQVSLFPVPIFGVNKNISGSLERGGDAANTQGLESIIQAATCRRTSNV